MRLAPVMLALVSLCVATRPAVAQGNGSSRPRGWCTDSTRGGDSSFVVDQAIRALSDSVTRRLGIVYRVDSYQAVSVETLLQGIIVSLVVAHPQVIGGGGLVWVDGETDCAIVLRRYE